MKNKKLLIGIVAVATVLLFLALLLVRDHRDNSDNKNIDKIKIKGYTQGVPCAANTPGCGYCPGEVIDEACYVTRVQFDEYKKSYSELEADK